MKLSICFVILVECAWSEWSSWGACSVTCATGVRVRTRTNQPCADGGIAIETCTLPDCPVDGNWESWGAWNMCSVTCATGTQSRTRTCTNPAPTDGGDDCVGDSQEARNCNTQNCPINGNWESWGAWNMCTVTCATGTQNRKRTCTNPAPADGGDDCSGDSQEARNCNTQNCPIDGDWTLWGSWSACGVTCSDTPVIRSRERSCANPEPQYNGTDCNGDTAETETCDLNQCPVDGNWGAWQDLTGCSVTCGTGIRRRHRACDSPVPARMGEPCQGVQFAVDSCSGSQVSCPGMYGAGMPYAGYDVGNMGYGYGGLGFGFGGGSGGRSMSSGFGRIFKLVIYVMVFVMIINLMDSTSDGLGNGGS